MENGLYALFSQVVYVSLVTPFGTSLVPEEAQCSGDHDNVFHFSARLVLQLRWLFETVISPVGRAL